MLVVNIILLNWKSFLFWRTVKICAEDITFEHRFDNLEDAQSYINIISSPKWIPIKTVIEKGEIWFGYLLRLQCCGGLLKKIKLWKQFYLALELWYSGRLLLNL